MKEKDLHLWNLCDFGISYWSIFQLVRDRVKLESFFDENDQYIQELRIHKPKLYRDICSILNNKRNTDKLFHQYSVYIFLSYNLSVGIVEKLISDSISFSEIETLGKREFILKFAYKESTVEKIYSSYEAYYNELIRGALHYRNAKESAEDEIRRDEALKLIKEIIREDHPITNFRLRQRIIEEVGRKPFNFDVNDLLIDLFNSDSIMLSSEGYIPFIMDLEAFVESILDAKQKRMLNMKLNGNTLDEIGVEFEISKQRVSQLLSKIISNRPQIKEDKFKIYYSKYDFKEQEFCLIFGVSPRVYNLFKIEINHGVKCIEDFIEDEGISEEQKFRVRSMSLKENEIIVNGRVLSLSVSGLIDYMIKIMKPGKTRFDSFHKIYNKFISDNLPNYQSKLIVDYRNFNATLLRSKSIVLCNDNSFRFYDWKKYDFSKLKATINLDAYQETTVSTLLFISTHQECLREYNILDQYELHYVLRTIYQDDEKYRFLRMPMIQVGETTREEFVSKKLYELSPIKTNDFIKYFASNYGYEEPSFRSYLISTFKKYIQDDVIDIYLEFFDLLEIHELKKMQIPEFIYKKNLKELFDRFLDFDSSSYMNITNFESLGFRSYSTYLISERYASPEEYFKHVITLTDRFSTNMQNFIEYKNLTTFSNVLSNFQSQLEIIEYEPNEFINIRMLRKIGIDKSDLLRQIESSLSYVDKDEFFTLGLLYQRGFRNELENTGFGDYFLTSMIIKAGKVNGRKFGNTYLLRVGCVDLSASEFIMSFFKRRNRIDLYDFSLMLKNDYGIEMDYGRIREYIYYTDLYFAEDLDTVYINKEEYLKEVFQDDEEFAL